MEWKIEIKIAVLVDKCWNLGFLVKNMLFSPLLPSRGGNGMVLCKLLSTKVTNEQHVKVLFYVRFYHSARHYITCRCMLARDLVLRL